MASDGCLSKDGRHVDLTSVDIEQVQNFLNALNKRAKITQKNSKGVGGAGRPAYRAQFSDVAYYDFLIEAGLSPNKSKTINTLKIPDVFYRHFLRGLFDGDGTCYGYYDKRWSSSFMYYVQFASASVGFLHYLRVTNSRLLRVGRGSIRVGSRVIYTCLF